MTKYKSDNFFKSLFNAIKGLKLAFFSQRNFQIELIIAIIVVSFACFCKFSATHFCILFIMITMVLSAELINSVIEFSLDAIYKNNYSKLVEMAKDISSGTVLLISITSVIVGIFLFYPYILKLVQP